MVYERESIDVPPEVASILAQLNEMESVLIEEPRAYTSGEKIVKRILRSRDELEHRINIIPGGVPGKCQPALLVAVGSSPSEDVEKRILQAYVHISNWCLATTTLAIFWVARWDAKAWIRYAGCFKNVVVILKLFGANPTRLK
ncbi:MAG: hypothetical protein HXY36_03755 [Chloroflexi bacterium]|nr:hypothetical protein [Chloroflexota bacterium]